MTVYVKQEFVSDDRLRGMHPTLDIMQTVIEYNQESKRVHDGTFDSSRGDYLLPDTVTLDRTRYFARCVDGSQGATLDVKQESHYHDGLTDYSIVGYVGHDDGTVSQHTITWAHDSGYGLSDLGSFVDASDAIVAAVAARRQRQEEEERRRVENIEHRTLRKGCAVITNRTHRSKKYPRGMCGIVTNIYDTMYGCCVTIRDDNGTFHKYVNINHVDVVPLIDVD